MYQNGYRKYKYNINILTSATASKLYNKNGQDNINWVSINFNRCIFFFACIYAYKMLNKKQYNFFKHLYKKTDLLKTLVSYCRLEKVTVT